MKIKTLYDVFKTFVAILERMLFFSQSYSCGPHPQRITRESQRALSWEAVKAMMELRETDIEMNYKCLTRKFNLLWFGASTVNYVSLSTIRRHVTDRLRWSRKVLERRNVNIDPEMQLTFMEDMAVRDVYGSHGYIVSNFWNLHHRNRLSYLNSLVV